MDETQVERIERLKPACICDPECCDPECKACDEIDTEWPCLKDPVLDGINIDG